MSTVPKKLESFEYKLWHISKGLLSNKIHKLLIRVMFRSFIKFINFPVLNVCEYLCKIHRQKLEIRI